MTIRALRNRGDAQRELHEGKVINPLTAPIYESIIINRGILRRDFPSLRYLPGRYTSRVLILNFEISILLINYEYSIALAEGFFR